MSSVHGGKVVWCLLSTVAKNVVSFVHPGKIAWCLLGLVSFVLHSLQGMMCVNLVEQHTTMLYHYRAFSSIYVHVAAGDSFLCLTFLIAKGRVSHDWAEMVKQVILIHGQQI